MAVCAFSVKSFAFIQFFKNTTKVRTTAFWTCPARHLHHSFVSLNDKNDKVAFLRKFGIQNEEKSKETFLEAVKMHSRDVHRRGHVEFIYSSLKYMEEFGVNRDLEVYKNILDVFPKGKFIPTNVFQVEFMHYPKQQQCAVDLLEQMEENGVIPDREMETQIMNIFGKHSFPMKKLMRMNYWMPKFRHLSPWALPDEMPASNLELGKLAVQRMASVDPATEIEVFDTKELADAIDETWIVSGQSPTQRELVEKMSENQTIYVEGAFCIWLRRTSINYFILRSEPNKPTQEDLKDQNSFDFDDVSQLRSWVLGDENLTRKDVIIQPSVHEQEDGNILAVAVTGTCSKDSLLSWIRFLERKNPRLSQIPILFSTNSPLGQVVPALENPTSQEKPVLTDGSD